MATRAALGLALLCSALWGCHIVFGFNDITVEDDGSGGAGTGGAGGGPDTGGPAVGATSSDKIDVLLMVDNSRAMADKQGLLSIVVADLVNGLTVLSTDIHFGVITSSLGGVGADACAGASSITENDRGHLITRGAVGGTVPTDNGILTWAPGVDQADLTARLTDIVLGAGEEGCGYEMPLEAVYRFLIDPAPYENIVLENNSAVLQGTDSALLEQRAAFLRDDSLVIVFMITDENDCSTQAGGQFYFAAQIYQPGTNNPYHLPPARAACNSDPNSDCCRSCGQAAGAGCDESADQCGGTLSALDDNINLRCWDQRRRFGIDFLYPVDRYIQGLTNAMIADSSGNVVDNPLFPDGTDPTKGRGAELVMFAGLVGVPWQDVSGATDGGDADWSRILGDPSCYHTDASCLPTDPLMIESIAARSGTQPVTGAALVTSSAPLGNPVNGHEYDIPQRDDLQYACIFDLVDPGTLMPISRDCTGQQNCDCNDMTNDNPLCWDGSAFGTTQYKGKAYPSIRPLQVVQGLGARGVVSSICPQQLVDFSLQNFAYRPMMTQLASAAQSRLQ